MNTSNDKIAEITLDSRLFKLVEEGKKDFVIIPEQIFWDLDLYSCPQLDIVKSNSISNKRVTVFTPVDIRKDRDYRRIFIGNDVITRAYTTTFFFYIVKKELDYLLAGDGFKTEDEFRKYYLDKFKDMKYGRDERGLLAYLIYFQSCGPIPSNYEQKVDLAKVPHSREPYAKEHQQPETSI